VSLGEFERIALLARHFVQDSPGTIVGIGDDCAVLAPCSEPLVWTIDAQIEGTHFRRDWLSWEDVGFRSFMAAASDLAAMGASPVGALSALSLPPSVDDAALEAVGKGQADAARLVGAAIIGGNLTRGTEMSVTTTLLGRTAKPVLRTGARAGEHVFVAGDVGMAAAGLGALETGRTDLVPAECLVAWRRPRALVSAGLAMRAVASAGVDISDGLSKDASHLAIASGVGIVFDEASLRARGAGALERAAAILGRDALDLMLSGGEDYALLVTSASASIDGFTRIGRVERGEGISLARADGTRAPIDPRGFDHFAER
jgi:thiamine-monophosphate kinase